MQGSTFKDLAADFLRQGLGLGADKPIVPPSASSVVKIDANGLPFVDCNPKAKVRRMNAQALVASFAAHLFHLRAKNALLKTTPEAPAVFCRATSKVLCACAQRQHF